MYLTNKKNWAFLLMFSVSWCLGAQNVKTDTIETVVVTAQRQQSTPLNTTESISVLTNQSIRTNVSRSTAEALIGLPGVWMQKTNHGGGSPFVRGLTGNQTLLLLDGIRLNNATYRYGPNQYFNTIDVLNIQQVEAVRGSGSVLYGSDALGGTIQVLTKEGNFSEEGTAVHGSIMGRLLSRDMELGGRASLELSSEKVSVLAGYSRRDFGELYAGGDLGEQAPSSYLEQAGDFKLKAKVGSQSILTLAYNGVFQSEVGRYDQVAQRGYQTYMFDPQNRQLAYARLQLGANNRLTNQTKFTIAYQNSLEGRIKQRINSTTQTYEEDEVNTLSFSAETQSVFNENWTALTGVEWYMDQVNSFKQTEDMLSRELEFGRGLYPDDSEAQNIALFTSHFYNINKWRMNAGARFNFFDILIEDATFGNTSIQPTALVGNLSIQYLLDDKQRIHASVNSGFRAPNINDLSSFGSFDFGIEVPSSTLAPEKNITYELGYKVNATNFSGNVAFYYMQLYNLISRVPGTFQGSGQYQGEDVYKKENTSRANIKGIEFDANYQLNTSFEVYGNLTFTHGQDEAKDEPLRRIPPLNGRIGVLYQGNSSLYAGLELWFAGKQDQLSGGDISDHRIADGGTPGWSVLNFRAGYQWNKLQLNAGWQNMLNTAYRIHGSGVDGSGSHQWIALGFSF